MTDAPSRIPGILPPTPSKPFFLLAFLACAWALAAAFIGQFVFGLQPCVLCLTERIPYALGGLVAALMVMAPSSPGLRRLATLLLVLAFAANALISAYHVGVEQQWWASAVCESAAPTATMSLQDLQAALKNPPRPSCDQVAWTLFGISLAGYNLLLSLALALWTGWALARARSLRAS